MREIKFRAWHEEMKEMFEVVSLEPTPRTYSTLKRRKTDRVFFIQLNEGIIFQQYTGLKDKNGNEIYEGDIVKITSSLLGLDPQGGGVGCRPEFILTEVQWNERGYWNISNRQEPKECEVLGNIYENPELLERAK